MLNNRLKNDGVSKYSFNYYKILYFLYIYIYIYIILYEQKNITLN